MADKYARLINERINRGKASYQDYLRERISILKTKEPSVFTRSEITRTKCACGKVRNIERFGCIIHKWLF